MRLKPITLAPIAAFTNEPRYGVSQYASFSVHIIIKYQSQAFINKNFKKRSQILITSPVISLYSKLCSIIPSLKRSTIIDPKNRENVVCAKNISTLTIIGEE